MKWWKKTGAAVVAALLLALALAVPAVATSVEDQSGILDDGPRMEVAPAPTDEGQEGTDALQVFTAAEATGTGSYDTEPFAIGDDLTPPELTGIRLLTPEVTSPGVLMYEIDLVEEGSGVRTLCFDIYYTYTDGTKAFAYLYSTFDESPLATGSYTIELNLEGVPAGACYLSSVSLYDMRDNYSFYNTYFNSGEDTLENSQTGEVLSVQRQFTVVESEVEDNTPPLLSGLTLHTREVSAPGSLEYTLSFEEEGVGLTAVWFDYRWVRPNGSTQAKYAYHSLPAPLQSGTVDITLQLDNSFIVGLYELRGITLYDANNNSRDYYVGVESNGECYLYSGSSRVPLAEETHGFTVVNSEITDVLPPELVSLVVVENTIEIPGMLEVDVEVFEDGTGVGVVILELVYYMTNGGRTSRSLYYQCDEPLFSGVHRLRFPITPVYHAIDYTLGSLFLQDEAGNYSNYYFDAAGSYYYQFGKDKKIPVNQATITLTSNYNIVLNTSLNDSRLASRIESLAAGDTAVVTTAGTTKVTEEIFSALAGKDANIIFDCGDLQWIFNGKDITQPKAVELWMYSTPQPASSYGLAAQETALELRFSDNGELPGAATVRLNSPPAGGKVYPKRQPVHHLLGEWRLRRRARRGHHCGR